MIYYHYSAILIIITVLVIHLAFAWSPSSPSSLKDKLRSKKNDSSSHIHDRASAQKTKLRNLTTLIHNRFKPSVDENDIPTDEYENEDHHAHDSSSSSRSDTTANVVVLTSLSGVYLWWPILFGGDDSFHLLLSQEDVPRFHDVTGDEHGHIYLTAPHERTVYRLQYSDGWWISNFSNHSLMNSIRSEMPLFVNIHHVSSILYVYGHSDIQTIDLLERPRARGSAPFMNRLRELSPNLRISDLIIDQLTSEGYIIGDSYGWCTVIRCSLSVNKCDFLFKIPSSYDNRPYPCTATIDFSTKIIYLSLEEKILAVHLNEQTNFDRRYTLTEKRGPRSTLGYDDIITHNNTILYTDVLRPLLHICTSVNFNPCLNISLTFPSPQRTILPLRLSVIQAPNFRPPMFDEEGDETEIHSNHSDLEPSALHAQNKTSDLQSLIADKDTSKSTKTNLSSIWMLLLGICIGLLVAGLSFLIYYVTWNKNRPRVKQAMSSTKIISSSSMKGIIPADSPPLVNTRRKRNGTKSKSSTQPSTDSTTNHLIESATYSSTTGSSEWTTVTTSSLSYQPHIIL
ncbi:unnamed protein product [Adineta ricciae]|uniref:Uncharacterized protein n=1 Tax=Adineta ricciae TaxID=249248 RepID=A0A813MS55_ADIRI|nr:unnamed protein product [Adineta ricciae]CAF1525174.1 unnamed protein product [Adineta ricciae]